MGVRYAKSDFPISSIRRTSNTSMSYSRDKLNCFAVDAGSATSVNKQQPAAQMLCTGADRSEQLLLPIEKMHRWAHLLPSYPEFEVAFPAGTLESVSLSKIRREQEAGGACLAYSSRVFGTCFRQQG
ncbi:hypothetical protein QAD02_001576 [Eretmocerus hayati]|uniref:Uncharacterized protein n=1 Tax=Eretmocerus hayati TaxID=131215 RepID=A0ACC2NJA6_9HYME|nr:hypothetical protein QAD02_001576 [Eretmocerus hayati]